MAEQDFPFEIPESWVLTTLGEILLQLTDGTHSTPKYTQTGIPFISVKDISSGYLSFSNTKYISELEFNELCKRCFPQKGDILLSKVGTTGIPVLVDTEEKFNIFVSVALLKLPLELSAKYLIYVISSSFVQNQAKENTKGVGNKNWVLSSIAQTIIPLPPLSEQYRIVKKLEEILPYIEQYAKAEEKLTALDKQFPERLKKSILQAAIQGKLTEQSASDEPASTLLAKIQAEKSRLILEKKIKKPKVQSEIVIRDNLPYEKIGDTLRCIADEVPFAIPENWCWVRQEKICWLENGIKAKYEESLPYLEAKVIRGLKDPTYKNSGVIVKKDDKVILVDGENSGEIMNIPYLGYMGSTFKKINISTHINLNYFLFLSKLYKVIYRNNKIGSAIPHLDKKLFRNILIPLPPLIEQERIVGKIEKLFSILQDFKKK